MEFPKYEVLQRIMGLEDVEASQGITKTISVRLDVSVYSNLFALAEIAGMSMNSVMVDFTQMGLDTVYGELSAEQKEKAKEIFMEKVKELSKEIDGGKK
jgi:hypothetical protein